MVRAAARCYAKRRFAGALLATQGLACACGWESTPWQRELIASIAKTAKRRSDAATPDFVARLNDQDLRADLTSCSPDTADMSASDLAERIRREMAAVEVVSGFATDGFPGQTTLAQAMTLDEAMTGPPFFEGAWQVGARRHFNFSMFPWSAVQDDVETQLYGFKPFSHRGYPQTMEEASERPSYFMVNLYRVDAGSPVFGDASIVLRTSVATATSVISAVDTGCWTSSCNFSAHHGRPAPWVPPWWPVPMCAKYTAEKGALGTFQHLDHLLMMNTGYWNVSLGRLLCRLLAPWGQVPIIGSDLIHYFEAMPAAKLSYPGSIKFVIGCFPSLFGTTTGARLQEWCIRNRWILLWSLGLNVGNYRVRFRTAVNLTEPFSSNSRLVDPEVLVNTAASVTPHAGVMDAAARAFRTSWERANKTLTIANMTSRRVSNSTWRTIWEGLQGLMPWEYHVEPLRAGVCPDADQCIGINKRGDCVCYQAADDADVVV